MSAPSVEAPPTIEGKVIPKEAIEAEIAKYTKPSTIEPPPGQQVPVTTKDLAPLPSNVREMSRSVYKMANDEFGESGSKAGVEGIIKDLFGEHRTTAYTEEGLAKAAAKAKQLGKEPPKELDMEDWAKVHRHLEKLYKPSVPKPPK